jgi:hypothetical protein
MIKQMYHVAILGEIKACTATTSTHKHSASPLASFSHPHKTAPAPHHSHLST